MFRLLSALHLLRRLVLRRPWLPWFVPLVLLLAYKLLFWVLRICVCSVEPVPYEPWLLTTGACLVGTVTIPLYYLRSVPEVFLWMFLSLMVCLVHYTSGYAFHWLIPGAAVVCAMLNTGLIARIAWGLVSPTDLRWTVWCLGTQVVPAILVPQLIVLLLWST